WNRDRNWDRNRGNHNWNRDWRRDNRYDWSGWRNQNRQVFRMGRYNPPYRDWSYRRLSIGFYLQSGFYGSNYWLDDPYAYRLPPANGPYRWVRYYDDALLVNIYDGEVVDVLHDFFW
ncbi:MAG: RcnB family protein, partial [Pseudomonadota bacterium]